MKITTPFITSVSRLIISILVCAFISACYNSIQLSPLPKDSVVLAFGDSLTTGYGTTAENSYPSILAQLSGYKVINAGISGETTEQGLVRFSYTLDEFKPKLVILMEGANDILQNKNLRQTKQNLNLMIHEAKSRNIQILLVAIPTKSLFLSSAGLYSELAEENNLILDNTTIIKLLNSPELKSDSVHFNQQGYRIMAERFYAILKNHGVFIN